jgi:hypothetical protein
MGKTMLRSLPIGQVLRREIRGLPLTFGKLAAKSRNARPFFDVRILRIWGILSAGFPGKGER